MCVASSNLSVPSNLRFFEVAFVYTTSKRFIVVPGVLASPLVAATAVSGADARHP